jgi:hypothetical protein
MWALSAVLSWGAPGGGSCWSAVLRAREWPLAAMRRALPAASGAVPTSMRLTRETRRKVSVAVGCAGAGSTDVAPVGARRRS